MTPLRTESFVPLTAAPAPPGRREFNVAVVQNGDAPKNFQALAVPLAESKAQSPPSKVLCTPRVSVQRDGGRVTHLRVQCTCGEVLDLACLYDDATPVAE